jgi:hypothetical protein
MRPVLLPCLAAAACLTLAAPATAKKLPDSPVAPKRDTEPVVLKGSALGSWSVPANQTVKLPFMDLAGTEACSTTIGPPDPDKLPDPGSYDPTSGGVGIPDPSGPTAGAVTYDPNKCPPQDYAKPEIDTAAAQNGVLAGTDVDRILAFRFDKKKDRFDQIPVQVDEVFTRYLDNSRSGFALYSGQDQHNTYAYDREGFRYTDSSPDDPCLAIPRMVDGTRLKALPDPVPGLDDNDEIAFMFSDAGPRAPSGAALPAGIQDARIIVVADPTDPANTRFVYAMRTSAVNPAKPAYDAANGYVGYRRDANADRFVYSQSSYGDYGNAPPGPYCTADGRPDTSHGATAQRRPLDTATIATNRYRFRYDGRWLLTRIEISPDEGRSFGPDLVDRWKARAFAQDPSSETPCCGFEEEDTHWGGSSTLLGERVGPVRAIRETWGADSGTNVIRRETFYRDRMVQKNWLRVHVIPPLDGIYAQWDFNAGKMTKFFNADHPGGVDVDGRNDEMYGNFDDPCNPRWDANDTSDLDHTYRSVYKQAGLCNPTVMDQEHASIDPGDATFADANASLGWSQVSGPYGTIVDRIHAQVADQTPGGLAQSLAAVPYYRDDACFDDGTGSDPGPVMNLRSDHESMTASDGTKRRCWKKGDPEATGTDHYFQGSIGTHGLHILFLADSDNARQTVPVTEIVSDWDLVMLPPSQTLDKSGNPVSVGEQYGRETEKPLVAVVTDDTPAP